MEDNWQHRGAGMKCVTCISFVVKEKDDVLVPKPHSVTEVQDEYDSSPALGRCRKHAPTMAGFPAVFETDWCGDHKLDENKC